MKKNFFNTDEDLTGLDGLSPRELAQIMEAASLDGTKPSVEINLDEAREFVSKEIKSKTKVKAVNFQRFFWLATTYAVAASVALIICLTPKNSYEVSEDEDFHASCDVMPSVVLSSQQAEYGEITVTERDVQYRYFGFDWSGEEYNSVTLTLADSDGTIIYKVRTSDDHISIDFEGIDVNSVLWTAESSGPDSLSSTMSGSIYFIKENL